MATFVRPSRSRKPVRITRPDGTEISFLRDEQTQPVIQETSSGVLDVFNVPFSGDWGSETNESSTPESPPKSSSLPTPKEWDFAITNSSYSTDTYRSENSPSRASTSAANLLDGSKLQPYMTEEVEDADCGHKLSSDSQTLMVPESDFELDVAVPLRAESSNTWDYTDSMFVNVILSARTTPQEAFHDLLDAGSGEDLAMDCIRLLEDYRCLLLSEADEILDRPDLSQQIEEHNAKLRLDRLPQDLRPTQEQDPNPLCRAEIYYRRSLIAVHVINEAFQISESIKIRIASEGDSPIDQTLDEALLAPLLWLGDNQYNTTEAFLRAEHGDQYWLDQTPPYLDAIDQLWSELNRAASEAFDDQLKHHQGHHSILLDEEALRPDPGTEDDFIRDRNPFAFAPGHMTKLLNPKSLGAFHALGGLGCSPNIYLEHGHAEKFLWNDSLGPPEDFSSSQDIQLVYDGVKWLYWKNRSRHKPRCSSNAYFVILSFAIRRFRHRHISIDPTVGVRIREKPPDIASKLPQQHQWLHGSSEMSQLPQCTEQHSHHYRHHFRRKTYHNHKDSASSL